MRHGYFVQINVLFIIIINIIHSMKVLCLRRDPYRERGSASAYKLCKNSVPSESLSKNLHRASSQNAELFFQSKYKHTGIDGHVC
jgi:hypothetical protein